jgi:hypothetical protein
MHGGGVDRARQRTGSTVGARPLAWALVAAGLLARPSQPRAQAVATDAHNTQGRGLAHVSDVTFE